MCEREIEGARVQGIMVQACVCAHACVCAREGWGQVEGQVLGLGIKQYASAQTTPVQSKFFHH